jgi:FemAB-related protein (PEP-CTERM system-associated)
MNMAYFGPKFELSTVDLAQADEAKRIDSFVRAHPDGTPFHLTAWSRAVAKGCGQKAHYLIAQDGEGAIVGILPLTEVRSKLFGAALVSSGFAVGGGILCLFDAAARQLTNAAIDLAGTQRCPTVELRGGKLPSADWHLDDTTYLGFSRELAKDDDAELLAIPRKQRAEVRKALGFDLTVETGNSKQNRDDHFAVYATSVRNLGTPVFPKALFDAMLEEYGDDADILTIRHNGTAIASVLSLYHNGTVMPYWGGGTAAARTWRANDLMYFALMRHARERGCTRFDFGRSKAGTGPASFKRNWGFEGVPLPLAKRSLTGEAPRDINPLSPKYRMQVAAWQKLPLWLANRLGPMISRGLG